VSALGHLAMVLAVLGAVAVIVGARSRGTETTTNPYDTVEVAQ
jgi:hypothetical protein